MKNLPAKLCSCYVALPNQLDVLVAALHWQTGKEKVEEGHWPGLTTEALRAKPTERFGSPFGSAQHVMSTASIFHPET